MIGDILHIFVPVIAFAIVCFKGTKNEVRQFLVSAVVVAIVTHILKLSTSCTFLGTRPNGTSRSFPSGHTSAAFQGALFLQKKYGMKYGMAAILLAIFVGYSRILGLYHHPRDVIAGFVISFAINSICVKRRNDTVIFSNYSKWPSWQLFGINSYYSGRKLGDIKVSKILYY